MSAHPKLVFVFAILAAGGVLLGGWIQSLKAFPAPIFIPPALERKVDAFEDSVYLHDSKEKLASGIANVLIGWNDLFAEPERAWENHENIWKGIRKGIVDSFANTAGGLLRIITFPFAHLKISLPEDGVEL